MVSAIPADRKNRRKSLFLRGPNSFRINHLQPHRRRVWLTSVLVYETMFLLMKMMRLPNLPKRPAKGTLYHPTKGHIVGYNFGTSVRPHVQPIAVDVNGAETVASFMARGGRIRIGAPKLAKGAICVRPRVKIAKSGANRTAGLIRFLYEPQGMRTSSLVSLANAQRPYNGSAMKTYGPR